MNDHPSFEELSSLFDGEAGASSAAELQIHLAGCGRCAGVLASMESDRLAIRGAWEAPLMPGDLRHSLLSLAPKRRSWIDRIAFELRGSLRLPAAAAAAACLALLLWGRGAGWFSPRIEIPADLFLAAHNQYELTLPLAPTERILTEMPRALAYGADPRLAEDHRVN